MKKKKLLSVLVAAALGCSLFAAVPVVSQAADTTGIPDFPAMAEIENYPVYAASVHDGYYSSNLSGASAIVRGVSPKVETHTIEEIRKFAKEHPVTFAPTEYEEEPSGVQPYKLGKVSSSSLQDALNLVNQIRYIAGLSHEVTLDEGYTELAQAASLVTAANGGQLSHYPERPAGMDDEMYQLGYKGASSSNLCGGRSNIPDTVVRYLDDGDSSNIDRVGHRRWVLNPTMGKIGFGLAAADFDQVEYSAMYAFDQSGERSDGTVSMWPAQNMPLEYFGSTYPWSFSTGDNEDIEKVKVTLTNTKTGVSSYFSDTSSDGYFNVNNDGYGLSGCIIFRPDNVTYEVGDQYHVLIDGLYSTERVEYDVNFFALSGQGRPGETISPNVERHTVDEIRKFAKEHPVKFAPTEYDEETSAVQPYKLGKVSSASLHNALNALNQIRYIAGLSYDVTLDEEFTELAQAACLVNAANNTPYIYNWPTQPEGMDDELYKKGYKGANTSALYYSPGGTSIAADVLYNYYDEKWAFSCDSDISRKILDPALRKTGFGSVEIEHPNYSITYSAMYYDGSNPNGIITKTAMWPAQNMPVEYFGPKSRWIFTTGNSENSEKVKVTLTNTKTGEIRSFSKSSSSGDWYVYEGGVSFKPDNVTYSAGDKYHVKIDGLFTKEIVEYDVDFFSLNNEKEVETIHPTSVSLDKTEVSLQAGKSLRLTATINPQEANDKSVEWMTSDSNIISVTQTGEVSGVSEGTAVVTVKTKDGGLTASCAVTVKPAGQDTDPVAGAMFRLYYPNSGEHLYTNNSGEKDILTSIGWNYEGVEWLAPAASGIPVYRVYNPNSGEHHYTTNAGEKDILVGLGWNDEGICWYSDENKGTPLYRLFNPNATGQYVAGAHHYTKNEGEKDILVGLGWEYEGIGWYGM